MNLSKIIISSFFKIINDNHRSISIFNRKNFKLKNFNRFITLIEVDFNQENNFH